jgi:2-polyprenyl-6-methoxyphenol hydroxylase-like FAD-dependent oxidoreductase
MNKGSHAVVIGGSMAGLLSARVLSEHFETVSVVERDPLSDAPDARKGVPQARHAHGFWERGLLATDRLLPGLRSELIDGGAITGDLARDFVWHHFGRAKLREAVGVPATVMTRPFLEQRIRGRVMGLHSIRFVTGQTVSGFMSDPDNTRITGVKIKRADGSRWQLAADLVVDASGRSGVVSRWLEGLGYGSPAESKVRIDVTHVTRFFRRTRAADALGYLVGTTPPLGRRGGLCFAVEGDRWQMTLVGLVGEEPPTDAFGFAEYARSLPIPQLYDITRSEEALSDAVVYRFPFDRRRHYERLSLFPEGLIAIGDALASFNPAYGQGMTVAALEVEALDRILRASVDLDGIARRFFGAASRIIDVPWSLAIGEDLRHPGAQGKRPWLQGAVNAYYAQVHRAAATDPVACKTFFEVAGLQAPPSKLFTPELLWRSLFAARRPEPRPAMTAPQAPLDVVGSPEVKLGM